MGLEVKGIIPAMATPMSDSEEIDEAGTRELINYLIDSDVHGIFICGSQGECYALTEEEKKRIISIAVDEVNGRVPVYAGTGATTTKASIRLSKYAEDVGADAVTIVTPYFIKPSQNELYMHYRRIAESIDIPVLIYNNPGRTGVNLEAETVRRLAEIDNIVGIKDSSGDLTLTAQYIMECPKEFAVLAGRDSLILATLLYGGKGAVAATANVAPKLVVGIYESFIQGDLERARKLQFKLLPLRLAFNLGTFPAVVKEAMNILKRPSGPARSPVSSLPEDKRERLKSILKGIGLIED
ncbi:4-hydroxy-tetrahydrodipicolinate synthase [Candidatus Bathyarchaeota archaeon]|nr:MAG: 4-hydroxy-tetrahydrodipicolinate synthase [Candidatus Bathyarchaeota archaeon]